MAYIPAISSDRIVNDTIVNADINSAAAIAYSKLNLGTSIVTGDLASSVTLDAIAAANATAGSVAMNSNKLTGLVAGSAAGDSVEYSQFAAALDGLSYKDAVRVATAASLPAYTRTTNTITASANGALPAIDGISLSVSDRLILKNGAAAADNGIWKVTALGDGSNPYVLDRTDDANTAAEITDGATTWVREGTANADTRWTVTSTITTLNTDAVTWAQTGSATSVTAFNDLSDVDLTGAADTAMLWNDAGVWKDTTVLLFDNDTGQMALSTVGSGGGILIGGDTQLYRSAANVLTTPDSFEVTVGGGKTSLALTSTAADTGITLGGDTNLYRSAADTLYTDDALTVGGALTVVGAADMQGILTTDGRRLAVTTKATGDSPYTASTTEDDVIIADVSAGTLTISLPATPPAGWRLRIKDKTGNALTNNITIDTAGAETIDGAATFLIDENYMAVDVVSDGTNYFVL